MGWPLRRLGLPECETGGGEAGGPERGKQQAPGAKEGRGQEFGWLEVTGGLGAGRCGCWPHGSIRVKRDHPHCLLL